MQIIPRRQRHMGKHPGIRELNFTDASGNLQQFFDVLDSFLKFRY